MGQREAAQSKTSTLIVATPTVGWSWGPASWTCGFAIVTRLSVAALITGTLFSQQVPKNQGTSKCKTSHSWDPEL